jgi:hypothetical protein
MTIASIINALKEVGQSEIDMRIEGANYKPTTLFHQ